MKGLFIPEITAEMFRNGCLESIEALMAEGEIYDIDYPLGQEPCDYAISRQAVDEMIKAEMPERGMWEIEGDKEKETVCEVCVDLIQKLSRLPSVTPTEKPNKWIPLKIRPMTEEETEHYIESIKFFQMNPQHFNLVNLIDDIKEIPPAESKWIPCEKRLPEAGEYIWDVAKYYLVQNEYGDMLVARYTHSGYWEQIYQLKPISDEIVAWMPLPEPYKAESEK